MRTMKYEKKDMNSNGKYEKEKIPFLAHLIFLKKLLVEYPNCLSGLSYGTPICLNPVQALKPLINLD